MKLLFSSLLFALAAASKQEGRGLQSPTSATALRDRWDMAEPKIVYVADDDKFALSFMTASDENYNAGLAATFWDPNCMPVEAVDGVQIGIPLIHQVGNDDVLPSFTMQDVVLDPVPTEGSLTGLRPQMEFVIDPAEFAKLGSSVYSGATPSCDTSGVPYSLLLSDTECPIDDHVDVIEAGIEACYQACATTSGCTQFAFQSSDKCTLCRGTAASLVPGSSTGVDTYEICSDIPAYNLGAGCTDTVTVVGLGEANDSTSCPHDNTALFDISGIGTQDDCYQRCYVESNCDFFTFSNLNGGRCMGCTSLGDASYPELLYVGPNGYYDSGDEWIGTTEPRFLCEGDCNPGSCAGDLVCAERDGSTVDTVPGCRGTISESIPTSSVHASNPEDVDYCVDESVYSNFAMCNPPTPANNANSRIDFCIRSSLGYTVNNGPANIDQTDSTSNSNYQEVNFIETLVRIEYDMSSGFEVEAFSVAPKNRELTTISESYENSLIAYLCDTTVNKFFYNDSDNFKVYEAPGALTDYNLIDGPYSNDGFNCDFVNNNIATYLNVCSGQNAIDAAGLAADCKACGGGITNTNGKKFNQGDLITVCVRVKEEFASQNIVLKELTDFSWTRSGGSTFNRAIGGGDDATTITQVAIQGSQAAGNYLTSYDSATCLNEYFCAFASVLFAQFYNTPGSVTGTGDAILQFQTTPTQPPTTGPDQRRLGGVDERSLQEDPGSAGMDISIDVNAVAEGPGDLKTAGGSSFGATTISVSVATALIGAILLA